MKYKIDFDPTLYRKGAGNDFIKAEATLDGDWICHFFDVPMDRYYSDYSYQREIRAEAEQYVIKTTGLDIVGKPVFDTGVVLNASLFGGEPVYHSNSTPVLKPVIAEPGDVGALEKRIDALSDEALIYEGNLHRRYWEAAHCLNREEGRPLSAPAATGTKGIATICGQLCGVSDFLLWIMTDPAEMKALTWLVGRTLKRYIRACRSHDGKEDANRFSFASDLTGLMSPQSYGEFCAVPEKELYETFAPSGTRYYHSDSNMRYHMGKLKEIGVTDVNIGPMISVREILNEMPAVKIHGQVPPVKVLWQGTADLVVDAVRQDIEDVKEAGADLRNLKVCTAGSINPGTPLENIRALYWAAMEFGRQTGPVSPVLQGIPVEFDRKGLVNQVS